MKNSHNQKHSQSSKIPKIINKTREPVKNNVQVSSFINEGNPNVQAVPTDKESAQVIKQAIKDDPSLTDVAGDINVTVEDGLVKLDGKVDTEQQSGLVSRTAAAVGAVDEVDNRMETNDKK